MEANTALWKAREKKRTNPFHEYLQRDFSPCVGYSWGRETKILVLEDLVSPWEEDRQHGMCPRTCTHPSGNRVPAARMPCATTGAAEKRRPGPKCLTAPRASRGAREPQSTFPDVKFVFYETQRASRRAECHLKTERTRPNRTDCWSSDHS